MTSSGRADYFPDAVWYAPDAGSRSYLVREPPPGGRLFNYSERHLQAVWFDARWRPPNLVNHRGEQISVISPGAWNLEAGPDFLGATLSVGPDRRQVTGDVEIHVFPAGWNQHGHQDDPRYKQVCLHVTYFEGALPEPDLPTGAMQLALRPWLKAMAGFSFDQVDVTAYPYAERAHEPPCRTELKQWTAAARMQLLDAAGHERMRQKAEHFAEAMRERGFNQVFYEAMMAALGYRHNKQPFYALAGLVPADRCHALSEGHPLKAFAILAGVAGLLPADIRPEWDDETRNYWRDVWDFWWRTRENFPVTMDRSQWHLRGLRPLNHPVRRLAAAAQLVARGPRYEAWMDDRWRGDADDLVRSLQAMFHPGQNYWAQRMGWGGARLTAPAALIGSDRLEAMILNILVPLAAACGYDPHRIQRVLETCAPEPMNQITRQVVFYLFGNDYASAWTASANRRQGLQQIFHDYCLHDRTRCDRCRFPQVLRDLRQK